MGFSTLPPELIHDIFVHVDIEDVPSLCLVSRIFRSEATPMLFEGVVVHAADSELRSWWGMLGGLAAGQWAAGTLNTKEIDKIVADHDRQQTRFFDAVANRPEMAKYVRGLLLYLYLSDPADPEDEVVARTVAFLPSAVNLRQLTIANSWRWDDPDEQQMQFILRHVPSSVTSLDLTECRLIPETIIKLLDVLPRLSSLTLASDFSQGDWIIRHPTAEPKLVHLETLNLLDPFRSRCLLQRILVHSNSLQAIHAVPISIQALSPRFLSHLTQLVIFGNFLIPSYPISTLVDNLASTLEATHNLESLEIISEDPDSTEPWQSFERIDLLSFLPLSIREISLGSLGTSYFSSSYMIHFIKSAPDKLERIKLERARFEEEDIGRVEEVARNKGIRLEWYAGSERWSDGVERDRGIAKGLKGLLVG